jgi:hypothetical protein
MELKVWGVLDLADLGVGLVVRDGIGGLVLPDHVILFEGYNRSLHSQ